MALMEVKFLNDSDRRVCTTDLALGLAGQQSGAGSADRDTQVRRGVRMRGLILALRPYQY